LVPDENCSSHGVVEDARVTKIYTFQGLKRTEVEEAGTGES